MNTELQTITDNVTNVNHLSGYDLTTLLIRGGLAKLNLNANAKMVLLYLATCYNEKKGTVFPRISTMAASLGIAARGVIRAIEELTEKGAILKSKRGRNKNVYILTNKVLNVTRHDDTSSSDMVSLPCLKEVKQHEVKQQHEVVVDLNKPVANEVEEETTSSTVVASPETPNINEIPDIIRRKHEEGKIRNLVGYWKSLRPAVKKEYWEQNAAEKQKIQRKKELEKQAQLEKQRKAEEWEQLKNEPSIVETYTREQAWGYCQRFADNPDMHKFLYKGICAKLIKRFGFNVDELCKREV